MPTTGFSTKPLKVRSHFGSSMARVDEEPILHNATRKSLSQILAHAPRFFPQESQKRQFAERALENAFGAAYLDGLSKGSLIKAGPGLPLTGAALETRKLLTLLDPVYETLLEKKFTQGPLSKLEEKKSRDDEARRFQFDDLKELELFSGSIAILAGFQMDGWPSFLMQARVSIIPKRAQASHAARGRPITVLALLYRCWGRVAVRQVLGQWMSRLPPSVSGCLPGRDAQSTAYTLQHLVECTLESGSSHTGFCMDLSKCFNLIPRCPATAILVQLGLPIELVNTWLQSVAKVRRLFQVKSSLSVPLPCTTGAPEGDAFSICIMLGIAYLSQTSHQVPL